MSDQAESLRRRVLESNRRPMHGRGGSLQRVAQRSADSPNAGIVAVVGASPRIGTTALAVQLALAWTRTGIASAIVDAHGQRPAVHAHCDVAARSGWQDVLEGRKTLREVCVTGPSGMSVVPFAGTERDRTSRQESATANAELVSTADGDMKRETCPGDDHPALGQLTRFSDKRRTIVDVGSVYGLAPYLTLADHCVFVTGATDESAITCYSAIKATAAIHHRATLWLVCNRAEPGDAAAQLAARLQITCDRCLNLELGYAGSVPYDSMEWNHDVEPFRRREASAFAEATRRIAKRIATRMAAEQAVALAEV